MEILISVSSNKFLNELDKFRLCNGKQKLCSGNISTSFDTMLMFYMILRSLIVIAL
jgi:hypothetical protein